VRRIYVDFSVYTPSSSEGWVHGVLEMPQVPSEGATLPFDAPRVGVPPPDIPGFVPHLVVEKVVTQPGSGPENVALSLADVTVATTSDAEKIFSYFSRGYGLDFDRTKEWTHA
jgi:hypothetical protein